MLWRAFNRDTYEGERFQKANLNYTTTAIQVQRTMAIMRPVMMLLMNFTTIGIIWFGGLRIDSGFMQLGDLMAFIQYGMHIMFSLAMLSMMFVQIPRATASAHRVVEVLDTVPGIRDAGVVTPIENVKGYLEFKDVTFSYPGAERPPCQHFISSHPARSQLSLAAPARTTLSSLILRLMMSTGSIHLMELISGNCTETCGENSFAPEATFSPAPLKTIFSLVMTVPQLGMSSAAKVAQAANLLSNARGLCIVNNPGR